MTLVEFFSKKQLENVISSLLKKPDKVVFVGYEDTMTSDIKKSTRSYLKMKNISAQTEFVTVNPHSLMDAVKKLTEIYLNNEDCVFDFTGGEELIVAGMGYIMAKYDVKTMEVNISDSVMYENLSLDKDGKKFSVRNSVYENLRLYGGSVDMDKQKSSKYNLSESFKKDVYGMWDICRIDNTLWNSTSGIFKTLVVNKYPSKQVNVIFKKLKDNGYIKIKKDLKENLLFEYKNKWVELCLKDPGVILELYTYFALRECDEFNDVQVGVNVDWDGVIHNIREKSKDTANEIDVVAMNGIIPVYISCKNGKVTKETLYELETVSKRFGGVYSAKILVAPILNEKTISHEYLINRAGDMGITVITDVSHISKEDYKNRIKESMGM